MDLDNAKWYCEVNGKFQDAGNGVGNPELGTGYVHNNLRIPYYTVGSSATQYGDTDDGLGAYFWNATSGAAQVFHINFGQKPFKYPPPKGYKTLSVNNLPQPSIPSKTINFDFRNSNFQIFEFSNVKCSNVKFSNFNFSNFKFSNFSCFINMNSSTQFYRVYLFFFYSH